MGLVKKVKWEMKKHLAIQILWQDKRCYMQLISSLAGQQEV